MGSLERIGVGNGIEKGFVGMRVEVGKFEEGGTDRIRVKEWAFTSTSYIHALSLPLTQLKLNTLDYLPTHVHVLSTGSHSVSDSRTFVSPSRSVYRYRMALRC